MGSDQEVWPTGSDPAHRVGPAGLTLQTELGARAPSMTQTLGVKAREAKGACQTLRRMPNWVHTSRKGLS
jgi:hypothetical protein